MGGNLSFMRRHNLAVLGPTDAAALGSTDTFLPSSVDVTTADLVGVSSPADALGKQVVHFTGAPGAGRSKVIAGPFYKMFANSSGQTVTVKNSAGDAGVALATGFSQLLWGDGTNTHAGAAAIAFP
jgi:hypothetical protein